MSNIEHEIMAFATTVRHLLLKYEKMKEELCDIKSRLADEEKCITLLTEQQNNAQQ